MAEPETEAKKTEGFLSGFLSGGIGSLPALNLNTSSSAYSSVNAPFQGGTVNIGATGAGMSAQNMMPMIALFVLAAVLFLKKG